jgi:hypothetical protein
MTEHAFRRWTGGLLGAVLGLAYALTSQWLNVLILPGLPLYQPPFGPVWNTVLSIGVGVLLGLIAVWPARWYLGVLLSAAVGTVLVQTAVVLTASDTLNAVPVTVCIFLPLAAVLLPMIALVRWATDRQVLARIDGQPLWRRVLLPLLLIVLAGGVGALALYPVRARQPLVEMNAIVQAAQQAGDRSALPAAYQAIDARGYPERLRGRYTLDWEGTELSRFGIPRPLENEADQVAVLARFEDGYAFACLFIPGEDVARCRGYDQWPLPTDY